MAHFTINLPNDRLGDVRSGTIRKEAIRISDLLRLKKPEKEEMLGYVVKIDMGQGGKNIYYLSKTKEGQWLQKGEDTMDKAIIHAIDAYEHSKE
jgi:hypothetical protein